MHKTIPAHNTQIISDLYNIGAIKLGHFTLKSGITSPIYIDLRQIISHPPLLRAVAETLWETIRHHPVDLICGIPYTGLPIATCISVQNNIPMILRRKEKKAYGTQQKIEGTFKAGQSCLLIEDVITTGSSVLETAKELEALGLIIKDIVVFIDREQDGKQNLQQQNYTVHPALTLTEILQHLFHSNLLTQNEHDLINQLLLERTDR